MRTQRRVLWMMLAGLLIAGSISCQIIVQRDPDQMPASSGGGGGQGGGQADGGQDGGDAG